MHRLALLLLPLGLTTLASAQSTATASRIKAAPCAAADTLLGRKLARSGVEVHGLYVPERHESLIFTVVSRGMTATPGIRAATGMIRLPEREVGPVPALELTLRVISDLERQPGTQFLRLLADDSLLGDSLPLALRRQEAPGLTRVVQTVSVRLTPAQTLALARSRRVTGALSGTPFALDDEELPELRTLVLVGLCGARKPW
jgi:hypothetical protein